MNDSPFGEDIAHLVPVAPGRPKLRKVIDPLGDSSQKPKKVNLNPIARNEFERRGLTHETVEHNNPYGGNRKDLWGFGDFLVCSAGFGIALVQVTTKSNAPIRQRKIEKIPEALKWLRAGGQICVVGFHQEKKGARWQSEWRHAVARGGRIEWEVRGNG